MTTPTRQRALTTYSTRFAIECWAVGGIILSAVVRVYGSLRVAPLLVALARKHPALDVQLRCEDRLVDMVIERIDIAVRILSALPAEFVARALADAHSRAS